MACFNKKTFLKCFRSLFHDLKNILATVQDGLKKSCEFDVWGTQTRVVWRILQYFIRFFFFFTTIARNQFSKLFIQWAQQQYMWAKLLIIYHCFDTKFNDYFFQMTFFLSLRHKHSQNPVPTGQFARLNTFLKT